MEKMENGTLKANLLRDEAKGLRQEIQNRSKAQHTLLSIAATSGGAIGAVAINRNQWDILLIVPVLMPLLGLMWLGHHVTITRLSAYLATIYLEANVDSYQIKEPQQRSSAYYYLLAVPLAVMFVFIPISIEAWFIVAWRKGWIHFDERWFYWLLGSGVVFTAYITIALFVAIPWKYKTSAVRTA